MVLPGTEPIRSSGKISSSRPRLATNGTQIHSATQATVTAPASVGPGGNPAAAYSSAMYCSEDDTPKPVKIQPVGLEVLRKIRYPTLEVTTARIPSKSVG